MQDIMFIVVDDPSHSVGGDIGILGYPNDKCMTKILMKY
jgi:hypothetical protein